MLYNVRIFLFQYGFYPCKDGTAVMDDKGIYLVETFIKDARSELRSLLVDQGTLNAYTVL